MVKKFFAILFFLLVFSDSVLARELEEYAPSINSQGFSGLFFTQSTQAMPLGHIALGGYEIYQEDSKTLSSISELNVTGTIGILPNLEIGGFIPYMQKSGSSAGLGDIEAGLKFRFSDQETEAMPALALSLVGVLPTGDTNNGYRTVGTVSYQGMLVADTKIDTADYSFYLNAEAGLYWGTVPSGNRERHYVYGGGAFLPLNYRLVLMLEADGIANGPNDADWVRFSGSLKYVTRFMQINAGIDKYSPLGQNGPTNNTVGGHGGVSFTF